MIIYEVNISVEKSILQEYISWLEGHIQEITNYPGFVRANLSKEEQGDNESREKYAICYTVKTQADLQQYLAKYAQKMRQEGEEKFKGKFTITRRILQVTKEFANLSNWI